MVEMTHEEREAYLAAAVGLEAIFGDPQRRAILVGLYEKVANAAWNPVQTVENVVLASVPVEITFGGEGGDLVTCRIVRLDDGRILANAEGYTFELALANAVHVAKGEM